MLENDVPAEERKGQGEGDGADAEPSDRIATCPSAKAWHCKSKFVQKLSV